MSALLLDVYPYKTLNYSAESGSRDVELSTGLGRVAIEALAVASSDVFRDAVEAQFLFRAAGCCITAFSLERCEKANWHTKLCINVHICIYKY